MFGLWGFISDIVGRGPLWRDGERTGRRCSCCGHCGCKMDEFGNELSAPDDPDNPENW